MTAPTRRDYLGWAATAFALVVTFSAEYELAKAVGIHHWVALAVPGALDVYVLRALQVRRDVFLTVLAMILVNAASHLVTAGVLRVEWPLIVAVSAIAPLVLWRSHVLGGFMSASENAPGELSWNFKKFFGVPYWAVRVPENAPAVPGNDGYTTWADTDPARNAWSVPGFEEHADQAQEVANLGTVNVPRYEDWLVPEDKGTFPDSPFLRKAYDADLQERVKPFPGTLLPEDEDEDTFEELREHRSPVLHIVPDVPAGELLDGDKAFLDEARNFAHSYGGVPPVRALKSELKVGAERASRIQKYLEIEEGTS